MKQNIFEASNDYQTGYDDCVNAIRAALQGPTPPPPGPEPPKVKSDVSLPPDILPPDDQKGGGGQGDPSDGSDEGDDKNQKGAKGQGQDDDQKTGQGQGQDDDQKTGQGQGQGDDKNQKTGQGQDQGDEDSRDGSDPTRGKVRIKDCKGPSGLKDTSGAAGSMIDRATGDKIAKDENQEVPGGGDEKDREKEMKKWIDKTIKEMGKSGSPGLRNLADKLANAWKERVDWRSVLKKVVGRCISKETFRRGFTNKNILATRGEIARTRLNEHDNMAYLVIALDMSGSFINDREFVMAAIEETASVANAKKPMKVVVVQWDTKITKVQVFKNTKSLKRELQLGLQLRGGGGTDPMCIWDLFDGKYKDYADLFRTKPELTMIFTDGYVARIPARSKTKMDWLVWVLTDDGSGVESSFDPPSDAKTIVIAMDVK